MMNKAQKILITIAVVILDLFLVAGACFHAYANYSSYRAYADYSSLNRYIELVLTDPRPYIAILITGIVGFFLLGGKNEKK